MEIKILKELRYHFFDAIKSLKHADDTTVIIKNELSYSYLNQEIEKIKTVPGSKYMIIKEKKYATIRN